MVNNALTVGSTIRVEKGCKARDITKGTTAKIWAVRELGPDYSHSVAVTFTMLNGFKAGKSMTFYARHANRLSDAIVNLNDGNPLHKIMVSAR